MAKKKTTKKSTKKSTKKTSRSKKGATGFAAAAAAQLENYNQEELDEAYQNSDESGGGGWQPTEGDYVLELAEPDRENPDQYFRTPELDDEERQVTIGTLPVIIRNAPLGAVDEEGDERTLTFWYEVMEGKDGGTFVTSAGDIKRIRTLIEGEDREEGKNHLEDHAIVLEEHCGQGILLEVRVKHRADKKDPTKTRINFYFQGVLEGEEGDEDDHDEGDEDA